MYQQAGIGVALMHWQLVAKFCGIDQRFDIRNIQHRIDPLGKHIQPQCNDIHIAGTLAIAK